MIFIALPAYNERENIGALLSEICHTMAESLPSRGFRVVVVDDGSVDETAGAVEDFAASLERFPTASVELVRHDQNKGLAEAIKTGLTFCIEQAGERDVILTMDADNSHLPGLIPSMLRKIHEGHDVVIASRYRPGARVVGLSPTRRAMSFGASWMFRGLFPIPNVRDYTCGYRAYKVGMLRAAIAQTPDFFSESGFSCMVDILLKLRLRRPALLMAEVPLLLRYDQKKGASKMDVGQTVRETLLLVLRRRLGR